MRQSDLFAQAEAEAEVAPDELARHRGAVMADPAG